MRILLPVLFFILFLQDLHAQQKYWVFFTDKPSAGAGIPADLDVRTAIRRQRLHLPYDAADFPVDAGYLSAVSAIADSMGFPSRWLNAVAVYATAGQAAAIADLEFVLRIEKMASLPLLAACTGTFPAGETELRKLAAYQHARLGGSWFGDEGNHGEGVRICIMDAGFSGTEEHAAFRHIYQAGKVIATYDFLRKGTDVFRGSVHGTMVFSCIGGMMDSLPLGFATGAEFLLARVEQVLTDNLADEDRWIAGLEWAEKNGADIVNSSLGFSDDYHFPYQLDGSSYISKAADIASSKGVLVVNSAGNMMNNSWRFLVVPADASHVLTVGATHPETDYQAFFSSVGPTADGRLKPEVTAPGWCTVAVKGGYSSSMGTSFSAPLVAGFAACLLKHYQYKAAPDSLRNAICVSGHLFPYFDYAHGYGIPQAAHFYTAKRPARTFSCRVNVKGIEVFPDSTIVASRNAPLLMFYHVEGASGSLLGYDLLLVESAAPVFIDLGERKGSKVTKARIHFEGYTEELPIE